jgi:signal transduction histidine kinase
MRFPGRYWRRATLRTRLVALAAAALVLALALSTVVLVAVLRVALERTVDAAARQTGRDVAALVDAGRLPDPIPAGGTTVVQVIDSGGRVRAASAGADRLVPMLSTPELVAVQRDEERYEPGYRFGVNGVVRVVAVSAGTPTDRQTVLVAVPAGDISESIRVVRFALLAGYGILLVVLVALAWRMVGAALRPVEALRRGAETVTGSQRLPLPRARDEIYRLAVTLNTMLARLDGTRARQRAFVADAAHELRSPLASLRTQVEVAEVTGLPAEPADLLADIVRLTRLVDDLLLLARLDDGPRRESQPVDLRDVVDVVVARQAGARVPVRRDEAAQVTVEGDSDELTRVVTNLVENAVRYADSRVDVRLVAGPNDVRIEVEDDGPGIADADRERVFERFTRSDDARDRGSGGAGLGLAIARELAVRHGGTVTLSSATPHGLVASVWLP